MNFALPAILLFVVVLPGFLFRARLKRAEQTSLDYSPFGRVVIEASLWALVLHAAWLAIADVAFRQTLRPEALLGLLSSSTDLQDVAVREVATSSRAVLAYFATLYAFAFAVPTAIRHAISRWRLDRSGARFSGLLRFHDAPWYYLLTGADFARDEEPDYIVLAAVIAVAGQPILYVGFLADFFFAPDGQLDRVVLENVVRRPLARDKNDMIEESERFYAVEGDYFVIRYAEVVTLNVHYLKAEPAEEGVDGASTTLAAD